MQQETEEYDSSEFLLPSATSAIQANTADRLKMSTTHTIVSMSDQSSRLIACTQSSCIILEISGVFLLAPIAEGIPMRNQRNYQISKMKTIFYPQKQQYAYAGYPVAQAQPYSGPYYTTGSAYGPYNY
ncbi:unnamed protein product [Phaedon cochleariae]|uniref:Uncharacterized protein n=1 Tax=Phaedon cochleariae TaxID=80249 RepID=A0A9N9WZS7_PHACE|nr:unnamed protein product [Phaedon cochleariae]